MLNGTLMNRSSEKQGFNFPRTGISGTGAHSSHTKPGRHAVNLTLFSATMFSAMLLSLASSNALANRPAMAEESTEVPAVVEQEINNRPEANSSETAPGTNPEPTSSVELIMQQQQTRQTYQTGDVMQLPATEIQPGETLRIQLLDYPRRGMSMEKVQNEYGQPIATSESIGKPPITHWTYSDRVVYFEYSTVLHVVAR